MPTSLVSTGVQFPDSSIQTTAATALPSPGTSGNVLTSNGSAWTSAAPPTNTVLLSTVTASNSATVDVETTFNSTYDRYLLVITKLQVGNTSTTAPLCARLKIGGTYQTSSYVWANINLGNSGSVNGTNASGSGFSDRMFVSPYYTAQTTNEYLYAELLIYSPADTNNYKGFSVSGYTGSSFWGVSTFTGAGQYTGSTSAMTGIRFLTQGSDNIVVGTFRLYGIKNS